jgi:hypothetical protein
MLANVMAIWYILWQFHLFYGHLVYFVVISYILWPFGIFWYICPVLVCCTKKNLATLLRIVETAFFAQGVDATD